MTLIQKINNIYRRIPNFFNNTKLSKTKILNLNPIILLILVTLFSTVFFIFNTVIEHKSIQNKSNLKVVTKSNSFSNLSNFLISKINSPYEEISYSIKNNDTIEKILKKFKIKNDDIKNISNELKKKKLSNIYTGRKISLIFKRLEDGTNTVVNLVFPVSNTTSIEIRKYQESFIVKENILKLYKKEVVVKNLISNNLYSSAINVDIEPNIIVEFARIFGFEVDFQRDIKKVIGLKYIMRNLKMIMAK